MEKTPRQTKRQWMVSHEWMVKPMQQTEWIEGEGLLIWLAEVFSSLGTGLYIVSIFVNNWWGALIGWLIIIGLKLPFHLAYLGKPTRFWRTMPPFSNAWKTSWIARGVLFTAIFSLIGLIQLLITYAAPMSPLDIAFKVIAGVFAVLTGIYCGFMMSYCKSVPFWNTGLLPIVIMNAGIADGLALLIGVGMVWGGVNFAGLEAASRILLLVNILMIGSLIMNSFYRSDTASLSARELLTGQVATIFWIGVVLLGIVVPLGISIESLFTGGVATHALMIGAVISHTIGAFALKFTILKVGIYEPIVPKAKKSVLK
jgi:formate-dependent nitrite reductase membrane component NrfD